MQHIHSLKLVLMPTQEVTFTTARANSLGPYLQGVLMEKVSGEYASLLHRQPFNPYATSCVLQDNEALVWQVNTLTDEAYSNLLVPLMSVNEIELKALDKRFRIVGRELSSHDTNELTSLIGKEGPNKFRVRFMTPTAFKRQGSYVFLPDVHLIFQNLLMRYFYVYEGSKDVDEETLNYIVEHARITSFNIHSQYFDHAMGKGKKVPAFVGSIELLVRGPQQLEGLCRMLLHFGQYSGIGIKTSMGMGGFQCL